MDNWMSPQTPLWTFQPSTSSGVSSVYEQMGTRLPQHDCQRPTTMTVRVVSSEPLACPGSSSAGKSVCEVFVQQQKNNKKILFSNIHFAKLHS